MKRDPFVHMTAMVLSLVLFCISVLRTGTLTTVSCIICFVLSGVSAHRSIVYGECLDARIPAAVLASLTAGTLPVLLGLTGPATVFLGALPYVFVAIFIIAGMTVFAGMRLDKVLFSAFTLFFSMAVASFEAVVMYLTVAVEEGAGTVANQDIVVQFAASLLISVATVLLLYAVMRAKGVRLIAEDVLEGRP